MTQHEGVEQSNHQHAQLALELTATEYRFLADMLLNQIEADPVGNEALESLVQRLFVLAVRADGMGISTTPH